MSEKRINGLFSFIADFAGGGLLCAFGILAALLERIHSGKGQIVDNSMTEGAAYVGSWLLQSRGMPIWRGKRGQNLLDGGAFFYRTYETSDGKYMSVGALEPQFYDEFTKTLGVNFNQYDLDNENCAKEIQRIFKTKTQREWTELFECKDACVFPVLDWETAEQHPHNSARGMFVPKNLTDGSVVPSPAPLLSRTPATASATKVESTDYLQQVKDIFNDHGLDANDIGIFHRNGALILPTQSKL